MKFFAIEPNFLCHRVQPFFISVEGNEIVNGRSNRHSTIEFDGDIIIIKDDKNNTTMFFVGGVSRESGYTIREVNASTPDKKYLLWFLWIGRNTNMLAMSIISYITIGGFIGDVFVLSDQAKPGELDRFPNVKFIKVELKDIFGKEDLTVNEIHSIKPLIVNYVNVLQYDWMIFSDADILCVRPNIMELFKSMDDKSSIWYSSDIGFAGNRFYACAGGGILTHKEMTENRNFSLNSGWMMLPCNDLGIDVLRKWYSMIKDSGYSLDDQGCLYALMIREKTWNKRQSIGTKCAALGYEDTPTHSESQIIHFYCDHRPAFYTIAKELGIPS